MTTSTSTTTYTLTQTATYLTEVILGAIGDILADLGIDLTPLYRDWAQDENAIKQWIEEQSLSGVVVECHQPTGAISPIMEFPVAYHPSGKGDGAFVAQRASLARWRAKLDRVPARTTYRLVCTFRSAHTAMPGWVPGSRITTDGMDQFNIGSLARGVHASASMRYYSRT